MNGNLDELIERSLGRELGEGFDVITVRAEGFSPDGARSYSIQVRPRAQEPRRTVPDGLDREEASLYAEQGKWNVPYLEKNAELLTSAGEYALAKNVWKTILKSGERMGRAYLGLGRCLNAEGKYPQAVECLQESIAYQPTVEAYRLLATIHMREGRDATAAETLERGLFLRNLNEAQRFEFHFASGNCFARTGKTESAEKHYRSALSVRPSADDVQCNLGTLYARAGRAENAIRSYRDAVASNPRNAAAWYGLGLTLREQGRAEDALEAFSKSLEINLAQPMAVHHLLTAAYETGRYGTAERIVSSYVEGAPFNASLLYSLAGLQIHLDRRMDARKTLERLISIQPGHEGARELLSRVKEDAQWAKTRNRVRG